MKTQAALLVFAKAPVPGQVKTRLIPDLGRNKATSLYIEFLTRTLNTARKSNFSEIQVWVSGDINHQFFTHLKNKPDVKLYQQTGKDLGQRMANAFDDALRSHPYAVLVGSDCPTIESTDFQLAADLLENGKDVVLGPAEDGGYYLIGLKENKPELFSDIKWSSETVFSETCSRIKKINLKIGLLSKRTDIDRMSDLDSYLKIKKQESVLNL